MGKYVAENTVKLMIKANKQIKGAKVAILGLTFKENCPDVRNTKVIDIINELKEYGINSLVHDPQADKKEVLNEYGIELKRLEDIKDVDAVILAVPHDEYKKLTLEYISSLYNNNYSHINGNESIEDRKVLVDVKGILDRNNAEKMDYLYWRL